MRIVSLPRRGGKTTAMLQWMKEAPEGEHRVCVCFSAFEAMRLLRQSRDADMGLESWQFVSVEDIRGPRALSGVLHGRGGHIVLGFDNLDLWLAMYLGREVDIATVTEYPS